MATMATTAITLVAMMKARRAGRATPERTMATPMITEPPNSTPRWNHSITANWGWCAIRETPMHPR